MTGVAARSKRPSELCSYLLSRAVGMVDDLWREAVALKRYRFHPMMLIGDEP